MTTQPLLAIRCITYNHESYIRQCLDGFVMQKTNFPFIAIVHDDASTDGTAKIIREYAEKYPQIIKPIYETENQYSKHDGSLTRIMNKAIPENIKYIAMCEGDDYWTDPNKLQMQVDFLEKNPDYGMCYTLSRKRNESKISKIPFGYDCTNINDLYNNNQIPFQTVVLNHNLYQKYISEVHPENNKWLLGDLPIEIWFSVNSKIKFLDIETAIYRIVTNSVNHQDSFNKSKVFLKSVYEVKEFFIDKYNIRISKNEIRNQYFYSLVTKAIEFNDYYNFCKYIERVRITNFLKNSFLKIAKINKNIFIVFCNLYKKYIFKG